MLVLLSIVEFVSARLKRGVELWERLVLVRADYTCASQTLDQALKAELMKSSYLALGVFDWVGHPRNRLECDIRIALSQISVRVYAFLR